VGTHPSILPYLIGRVTELAVTHAQDEDPIVAGRVYVAPPDHHLIVVDQQFELSKGPRENWARPAIDPLFRTAAEVYGADCIGVVLSGALNDGTAGLYEIKRRGGFAIVQDPNEADDPQMPRSARDNVDIDMCLRAGDIPSLLIDLAGQKGAAPKHRGISMTDTSTRIVNATTYTCPDCGGAFSAEEKIGSVLRFKCHIGHAITGEILAKAQLQAVEESLNVTLRAMNEYASLCRLMATSAATGVDTEKWMAAERQIGTRLNDVKALTEQEWLDPVSPENARQQPASAD
jgi:two-component system chemotaxis response regulator CheB